MESPILLLDNLITFSFAWLLACVPNPLLVFLMACLSNWLLAQFVFSCSYTSASWFMFKLQSNYFRLIKTSSKSVLDTNHDPYAFLFYTWNEAVMRQIKSCLASLLLMHPFQTISSLISISCGHKSRFVHCRNLALMRVESRVESCLTNFGILERANI